MIDQRSCGTLPPHSSRAIANPATIASVSASQTTKRFIPPLSPARSRAARAARQHVADRGTDLGRVLVRQRFCTRSQTENIALVFVRHVAVPNCSSPVVQRFIVNSAEI